VVGIESKLYFAQLKTLGAQEWIIDINKVVGIESKLYFAQLKTLGAQEWRRIRLILSRCILL